MNNKNRHTDNPIKSIFTFTSRQHESISTSEVALGQFLDGCADLIEKCERVMEKSRKSQLSIKHIGVVDDEKAEAFAKCLEAMPNVFVMRLFNGSFHCSHPEKNCLNDSIYRFVATAFGMRFAKTLFLDFLI